MSEIANALAKITNNFETGFGRTTLMGWIPNFDKEGRPLNCNPNHRTGSATIEGTEYFYKRCGWKVTISDKNSTIEEIDLTPDYIKQREDYHN